MRARRGVAPPRRPFFIDRSIGGTIVPEALRALGVTVERHDDHLLADAPDPDWIALVAERDWIGLTRDARLEYAHRTIVEAAGARIFVLRTGGAMAGDEMALVLAGAVEAIYGLDFKHDAPFIAHISSAGKVSMPERYEKRRRNPRSKGKS